MIFQTQKNTAMKTLQVFLFLLTISFGTVAAGNPPGQMIVRITAERSGKAVNVQLANLEGARTELSIIAVDGMPWHSQYIWQRNGFAAHLDLTLLEPGDYIIQVANRKGRVYRAFTLSDEAVTFLTPRAPNGPEAPLAKTVNYRLPDGRLIARFEKADETGKLDVQLANLLGRTATMYITSLDGIPVYEETLSGLNGVNRRMDLNGLGDTYYFLYLKTANATVVQFFRLHDGVLELKQTVGLDKAAPHQHTPELITRS